MTVKHVSVGSLKKGSYVVIDGEPCIVLDVKTSAPGKHGSAKANITAIGIIDNKKRNIVKPAHEDIEVPIIEKKNAQVLSVQGSIANVMDLESYETFDLEIPEELREKVVEGATVHYWDVLGKKILKAVR